MKTIKNVQLVEIKNGDKPMFYSEILASSIKNPPDGGFTLPVMALRLKILDKLENAKEEIVLEDTEAQELKTAVGNLKFTRLDKELLDFVNFINSNL